MVGGANHSQSHLSAKGPRRLQVWATMALGITVLLLSMAAATLLASAKTSAVYKPVAPRQVLSPAHGAPQMTPMTTVSAAGSFSAAGSHSAAITTTALLPIMVNGYPPPYAWTGEIVATYPNCSLTRLFGFVLDQYGQPVGDVWVHLWADNFDGYWYKSSSEQTGDHNWDGTLDNQPREVVWYTCIVPEKKSRDCQSNTVKAPTSANCETGIQVYQIDFHQN